MSAIGIDVGGHHTRIGLVDSTGEILEFQEVITEKGRTPEKVLGQILWLTQEFLQKGKVTGIGIGVPGFMDSKNGIIFSSPNFPGWEQFPLSQELNKSIQLPFLLQNDANCAALGEHWVGVLQGAKNAVHLTLGTGVGGGVIVNGQLITGKNGAAGEVGHMTIDQNGPKCGCGSLGCIEAFVSGDAILHKTKKEVKDWEELALQNDPKAIDVFHEMGKHLGVACASICQIFDPEVISFGGKISLSFPLFETSLREELNRRLQNHPAKNVRLSQAMLGDQAGVLGAARPLF